MKVSELMVTKLITCPESAPLGEAARLMWEHDVGFLPVVAADGTLAGVITDRDGFIAAYFQGRALWDLPVSGAMSSRVYTCPPDADVEDVDRLMREFQVHRMPVVTREGKLVGLVSINDIARRAMRDRDRALEEDVAATLGFIAEPRPAQA